MIIKSDYIRDTLSYIQTKVKNDTKQKMYGINETAENIFMHLLNDTFGYHFKNANDLEHNFPAIDLIDTTNKIVIQVTSDTSTDKVRKKTLEKFETLVKQDKYKHYANYKIMMFYIKDKPSFSPAIVKEFEDKGLPSSHFLGIDDINARISTDTVATDKVYTRLKHIFDDRTKSKLYFLITFILATIIILMLFRVLQSNEETNKGQSTQYKETLKLLKIITKDKEEEFLKNYFGNDWKSIVQNPQTYHNLKLKLSDHKITMEILLKEKNELLNKIKSSQLNNSVQRIIDKAFSELRFNDVRDLLDSFIKSNKELEKDLINAHYQKAMSFIEELKYQEAKAEFEEFIPIGIKDANILNDYGTLYYTLGDYEKAELLYLKAVKTHKSLHEENHINAATTYDNLAGVYVSLHEYKKAKKLLTKALTIRKKIYRDTHEDTATSYDNLAELYMLLKKYTDAKPLRDRALKIRKKILGTKHIDTLTSYNNVAVLYALMGQHRKAIEEHNNVLSSKRKILGNNHPSTATSCNNLANSYLAMNKYKKAKVLYEETLRIHLLVLGNKHIRTADSYTRLANFHYKTNNFNKSYKYMKEAISIEEKVLPEGHHTLITDRKNLEILKSMLK